MRFLNRDGVWTGSPPPDDQAVSIGEVSSRIIGGPFSVNMFLPTRFIDEIVIPGQYITKQNDNGRAYIWPPPVEPTQYHYGGFFGSDAYQVGILRIQPNKNYAVCRHNYAQWLTIFPRGQWTNQKLSRVRSSICDDVLFVDEGGNGGKVYIRRTDNEITGLLIDCGYYTAMDSPRTITVEIC